MGGDERRQAVSRVDAATAESIAPIIVDLNWEARLKR
jgi:hypothetical protein